MCCRMAGSANNLPEAACFVLHKTDRDHVSFTNKNEYRNNVVMQQQLQWAYQCGMICEKIVF